MGEYIPVKYTRVPPAWCEKYDLAYDRYSSDSINSATTILKTRYVNSIFLLSKSISSLVVYRKLHHWKQNQSPPQNYQSTLQIRKKQVFCKDLSSRLREKRKYQHLSSVFWRLTSKGLRCSHFIKHF